MSSLPTHHVYDVPPEVVRSCCLLADLFQPFGPRFQSFSRFELLRVAREVFDCVALDAHWDEEELLECITSTAAEQKSHEMFILQFPGSVVQGFVLLVPNKNLKALLDVLLKAGLRLPH